MIYSNYFLSYLASLFHFSSFNSIIRNWFQSGTLLRIVGLQLKLCNNISSFSGSFVSSSMMASPHQEFESANSSGFWVPTAATAEIGGSGSLMLPSLFDDSNPDSFELNAISFSIAWIMRRN